MSSTSLDNTELDKNKSSKLRKVGKWVLICTLPLLALFIIGLVGAMYGVDTIGSIANTLNEHSGSTLFFRMLVCTATVIYLPEIIWALKRKELSKTDSIVMRMQLAGMYLAVEFLLVQNGFRELVRIMGG